MKPTNNNDQILAFKSILTIYSIVFQKNIELQALLIQLLKPILSQEYYY